MEIQGKRDLAILRTFIRSERLRRNISQNTMAEHLEISQNSYSKLELGYVKIQLDQLMIIADFFEMRLIDILNMDRLFFVLQQREISYKVVN